MASHSHLPNAVRFFKIILQCSLQHGKLKLPNSFIRKYGDGMPNPVFLKPPDGKLWEIYWTKNDDGGVWFEKGWREVASYYCLDHGHLVLFNYVKEASLFEVNIFDKSCLEIEYPLHANLERKNSNDDSDSVDLLYEIPPPPKKASRKPPLPSSSRLQKKTRTGEDEGASNMQIIHRGEGQKRGKPIKLEEDTKNYPKRKAVKGRTSPLTSAEKAKALERVSTFMSENPHFKIAIQPAYTRKSLNVPANFVLQYLKRKMKKNEGPAILRVSDGRTWRVMYKVNIMGDKPRLRFCRGWLSFGKDNDLKVGDVCVFELTSNVGISFLVHVFGDSENPSCSK